MMKLSEMMRLGSMQIPECYGPVYKYDDDHNICAACALGTLLLVDKEVYAHPANLTKVTHPVRMDQGNRILDVIISLFETHRWTRLEIADWLETVEASEVKAEAEAEAEAVETI